MDSLIRSGSSTKHDSKNDLETLITREWLVTNGLGGYASGTIAGINTRRYHGLLIASLPVPYGRMVLLNQLVETLVFPNGESIRLTGEERISCALQMHGNCYLKEFLLDQGLPVWRYQVNNIILEKRLFMRYQQNTVQISYQIVSGEETVELQLHPNVNFRAHHVPVDAVLLTPYILKAAEDYFELSVTANSPVLRMMFYGSEVTFTSAGLKIEELIYRMEESHGYPSRGTLWSPGYFHLKLRPGQEVFLVAFTHSPETIKAMSIQEAVRVEKERRELLIGEAHPLLRNGPASDLVLAADQFIIIPAGRREDAVRIRAMGGDIRTVIAGYHWFTDWGRDTMISLEGLALLTGRYFEARWILHTFAHYIRNGLIPNMFPEGEMEGIYNTADATFWYFHALDRYLDYTGDKTLLHLLLPELLKIIESHIRGTSYSISVDPADGLLKQGQEGFALTWMDAKVGDWVVTPRRGKAVEINALWYNALRLMEQWVRQERGEKEAQFLTDYARLVKKSFNRRFWYAEGGYLFDVVDGNNGDDLACRPNQVLAISLRFPVLERARWKQVMDVVTNRLLTPVGLRSLSQDNPECKAKYFGDIQARDAAYHQGTVWAWLIGPYIDAWLKLNPGKRTEARHFLKGLISGMDEACIGTISEIFDANAPFHPRGCVAQAWSVAEVLRCWLKTAAEDTSDLLKGGQGYKIT